MEVQPVKWEVQPLFYKPNDMYSSLISWDGNKFYNFKIGKIEPSHWIAKFNYLIYHTDYDVIKCDGYYDRDNKVIYFFNNRKILKEYQHLVKYQKLEHTGQTFLTSERVGEKHNMSMKELEGIKSGRVDLDEAPDRITPTKIESKIKPDPKDEVDCLYVDFYWMEKNDEVVTTMKYRPFHIKVLLGRMKEMKIKNIVDWTNKLWLLERKPFGTLGYPHYLPAVEETA